jgi:hypothetical protein
MVSPWASSSININVQSGVLETVIYPADDCDDTKPPKYWTVTPY